MACHKRRHMAWLRSPITYATTCLLQRHNAIQIHAVWVLFSTNDHSSSNSSVVASGTVGSGWRSVLLTGGSAAAFFEPADQRGTRDTKGAREGAQARALLIRTQNLIAAFEGIGMWRRVLAALTVAGTTAILLFAVWGAAIFGELLAATMGAAHCERNQAMLLIPSSLTGASVYHTIRI